MDPRLCVLTTVVALGASPAAAGQWEFITGGDYSTGRYGAATDTQVATTRLETAYQGARFRLSTALPVVALSGPGELVDGVPAGGGEAERTRRSGVGDAMLAGYYFLNDPRGAKTAFEIGATTKVPTARSGIGTGKADADIMLNVYHRPSEKWLLFASAGHSWLGQPADYELRNGVTGAVAANYFRSESQTLGLAMAYRERFADDLKPQLTLSPYLVQRVSPSWGLTVYGTAGLTSASPRLGAGFRITLFR
jgi:hypothetical protein